jgi:Na+/H+-dicarboxylate symporter
MTNQQGGFLKNYRGILLLLGGIIAGSILGVIFGSRIEVIKPIGDIFLNLLFTAVVPLVFFAIASAIANIEQSNRFGKLIWAMLVVFVGTLLIAAFITVVTAWLFPIHQTLDSKAVFVQETIEKKTAGEQITQLLTASEFFQLLSRKSMLALIIFSVFTGFATLRAGEKGASFRSFLQSGNEVMKNILELIMVMAPVGLGCYFAYQVGTLGPQLFGTYGKAMLLFHGVGFFYYFVMFSIYAILAGGIAALKIFWKNNIVPSATAIGTCSSIATIPANLEAAKKMRIPDYIANMIVPLGAPLHKEGSSISSITKIVVVFAMFNIPFSGIDTIALALGISVVVSVVEGGIPNGGYIGEMLVLSVYAFPPEALPAVMIIGTLVDPIATLLNATGDTVSAMMVTRLVEGKKWLHKKEAIIPDEN